MIPGNFCQDNSYMAMVPKRLVLFHRDADGFGAAYACYKAFETALINSLRFIGVQYGEPLPEISQEESWDEIYIVDFSYPLETLLILAQDCPKVIVIDHHKTAQKTLIEFNEEMNKLGSTSHAIFSMIKSGAVLTWEYFFSDPVPEILQYVQDRDLWKWELIHSRAVNLYISTLAEEFYWWDKFDLDDAITEGCAIEAYQDGIVRSQLKNATLIDITVAFDSAGQMYRIPTVNCTACISEVGNELCKAYPEAPFSMTYCDRPDGKRSYSLRSIGDFDVSVVAKAFGGGGHRNAAGFTLDAPEII